MQTGIAKAIRLAGSARALGALMDPPVSNQAVDKWSQKGWVPAMRVPQIVALYPDIQARELMNPAIVAILEG